MLNWWKKRLKKASKELKIANKIVNHGTIYCGGMCLRSDGVYLRRGRVFSGQFFCWLRIYFRCPLAYFLFLCVFFLTCLIPNLVSAEKKTHHMFCQKNFFVRTIRVERNQQGCRTIYTKRGIDKEVGSGIYLESCFNFLKNVEKNLGIAGWQCRDASESRMSADDS